MVLPGNLQDIYEKTRELSASGNSFQLNDPKFIKYLNSAYLYDIPTELRVLKLQDTYVINTIRGIDTYDFDSVNYQTVHPPAYCSKRPMSLFLNIKSINNFFYQNQFIETLAQGDGTAGPYTGTTTQNPILRSIKTNPNTGINPVYPASRVQNILITASNTLGSTQNVIDDGNNGNGGPTGGLIDPITGESRGTINYETGAISVTFGSLVTSGTDIKIEYTPISLAQPTSILYYQEQFTVRPVPDKGYTIEMQAYRTPSQVLMGTVNPNAPELSTGRPERYQWWELLAACVAKKLYQDRLDMDGVAIMQSIIDEQILQAVTDTYAELGSQRVPTIFAQQLDYASQYYFGGNNNR